MITLVEGRYYRGAFEPRACCVVLQLTATQARLLWLTSSGNPDMGDEQGLDQWTFRDDAENYLEPLPL